VPSAEPTGWPTYPLDRDTGESSGDIPEHWLRQAGWRSVAYLPKMTSMMPIRAHFSATAWLAAAIVVMAAAVGCGSHQSHQASLRISGEGGIGPILSIADLRSARSGIDPGTGKPVIVVELTQRGVNRFKRLMLALVQAGALHHRPFHFFVAVNGRVLTRPYIDYRLNPTGLDASSGIEIDGLRSPRAAQDLAMQLAPGR
jgi:preprotein translocase subunit SecD